MLTPGSHLQTNLRALANRNPSLAPIIKSHTVDAERYSTFGTKDGNVSVQYYHYNGDQLVKTFLHSRYSPIAEAERFAAAQFRSGSLWVYGFGLGYHIRALVAQLEKGQSLQIVESNLDILRLAFELCDLSDALSTDGVDIIYLDSTSEWDSLAENVKERRLNWIVHRPSVNCANDSFIELKRFLTKVLIPGVDAKRMEIARNNHSENLRVDSLPISNLYEKHLGATFFLVSSGPSLNQNFDALRRVSRSKGNGVIICAGSAFRVLVEQRILPDYMVLLDAHPLVRHQLDGCESVEVPLLFSIFACASAVQAHSGPKYIYYAELFPGVAPRDQAFHLRADM